MTINVNVNHFLIQYNTFETVRIELPLSNASAVADIKCLRIITLEVTRIIYCWSLNLYKWCNNNKQCKCFVLHKSLGIINNQIIMLYLTKTDTHNCMSYDFQPMQRFKYACDLGIFY